VAAIACWHLGDDRPGISSVMAGIFGVGALAAHAFVSAGIAIFALTEVGFVLFLRRGNFKLLLQKSLLAATGGIVCAVAGWLGYVAILGWLPPIALVEITFATAGDVIHRADQFAIPFRQWVLRNYDVYLPFVLVVAAIGRPSNRLDDTARRFTGFALLYFGFYLFWEFARTGIIFELFYYFAYLFPAIILLLAVILSTARQERAFHASFSAALVVVAMLFARKIGPLQAWLAAPENAATAAVWFLVASSVVAVLILLWRARPAFAGVAGGALAIVLQTLVLANPDYGNVFGSSPIGRQLPLYRSAIDIARMTRSHSGRGDWVLTWTPYAGDNPFWNMQAVNYATLVRFPFEVGRPTVPSADLERFADRRFRNVLILGTSDTEMETRIAALRAGGIEVVDRERTPLPIGLARMVEMSVRPPFVLRTTASQLPSQVGRVDGEARVAVAGDAPAGFVSFGPYMSLAAGKYEIQIGFGPTEGKQSWDIVGIGPRREPIKIAAGVFPATEQSDAVLKVPIEPKTDILGVEVRSYFAGSGRLTVRSLGVRVLD
jgi:hypothetical protein